MARKKQKTRKPERRFDRLGQKPPCADCVPYHKRNNYKGGSEDCQNTSHYRECLSDVADELKRMSSVGDLDFSDLINNIEMSLGWTKKFEYITAYDPTIKKRVLHLVKNGFATSMITGNSFRYPEKKRGKKC